MLWLILELSKPALSKQDDIRGKSEIITPKKVQLNDLQQLRKSGFVNLPVCLKGTLGSK